MDIGMETLYSRTLQIQFIETVAVEILNIQRSDIPQSHAELTEVRSDSLFDVIYIFLQLITFTYMQKNFLSFFINIY